MRTIPWRLILLAIAAVLILAGWNSFARHIPFTPQWSAHRAEARADYAEQDATNRGLEADGNAETLTRVETYHTRETIYRDLAHQAETEARTAPDADTPLSDERAARLRAHDLRMCSEFPAICARPEADAS